jgi:hypothetical protein
MLVPPRRKKGAIEGRAGPQPATGTRTNCFWYQKHWPLGSIGYEIMGTSKKIHGFLFGGGGLKQTNFKNISLGNRLIRKSLGSSWEMLNHQTASLSESEKSKTDHDRHPEYHWFVLSLSKKLRPGVQMQSSKWQWKIPYQYVYIMYVCMYVRTYVRMYVCMYDYVCMIMYVCMYVYIYISIYVYINIYIYNIHGQRRIPNLHVHKPSHGTPELPY